MAYKKMVGYVAAALFGGAIATTSGAMYVKSQGVDIPALGGALPAASSSDWEIIVDIERREFRAVSQSTNSRNKLEYICNESSIGAEKLTCKWDMKIVGKGRCEEEGEFIFLKTDSLEHINKKLVAYCKLSYISINGYGIYDLLPAVLSDEKSGKAKITITSTDQPSALNYVEFGLRGATDAVNQVNSLAKKALLL